MFEYKNQVTEFPPALMIEKACVVWSYCSRCKVIHTSHGFLSAGLHCITVSTLCYSQQADVQSGHLKTDIITRQNIFLLLKAMDPLVAEYAAVRIFSRALKGTCGNHAFYISCSEANCYFVLYVHNRKCDVFNIWRHTCCIGKCDSTWRNRAWKWNMNFIPGFLRHVYRLSVEEW